jgi:hypothetical protein
MTTMVGPPGGLLIASTPSNVPSRRSTPRSAGAACRIGSPGAIVADLDPEQASRIRRPDLHAPRAGVLCGIGQDLGVHEVRGRLDRCRQASGQVDFCRGG